MFYHLSVLRMRVLLIVVLAGCIQRLYAQQPAPLFHNGDRVCWVGNSITNNGEYYQFIHLFYATRFPNERMSFYNCGISGDVASGILRRVDNDVLIHQPTKVVLKVGMNDVKRSLYSTGAGIPEKDKQKAEALTLYREKTEELVRLFKQRGLDIILLKPTIYDQTAQLPSENFYGVNDALKTAGEHIEALAKKYNTRLVDFWTIMNCINQQLQQKDVTTTLIGKDRVHPGSPGHFVMAYQFLTTLQPNKYVAKIVVDGDLDRSKAQSFNCALSDVHIGNGQVGFSCQEGSLPFPVSDAAQPALDWVPFMDSLNQELLQVTALKAGDYDLLIDGQLVGSYNSQELNKGVNLAGNKQTPQYRHALKIVAACQGIRSAQSKLRNIKFVELHHLKEAPADISLAQTEAFLQARLETEYKVKQHSYYQTQFTNYIRNKPRQAQIEQQILALEENMYQQNKPVVHQYQLKRK